MLLIREVFTAKPGQASKLAKLFQKMSAADPKMQGRIYTDYVGDYNTVVMEMEVPDLATFDKQMEEYKSAKPDPNMDPELLKEMANYTEMYLTGRREIWKIWE